MCNCAHSFSVFCIMLFECLRHLGTIKAFMQFLFRILYLYLDFCICICLLFLHHTARVPWAAWCHIGLYAIAHGTPPQPLRNAHDDGSQWCGAEFSNILWRVHMRVTCFERAPLRETFYERVHMWVTCFERVHMSVTYYERVHLQVQAKKAPWPIQAYGADILARVNLAKLARKAL